MRSGPTSSTTSPTAARISSARRKRSGQQMDGRIDGFTCAVGTGGTLAGVGMGLKGKDAARNDRAQRSVRRGALRLLCAWRAQVRRLVGRRGDRAGPDHRQSGRRAGRYAVPHQRRGRARMGPPAPRRGGALPRAVVGDQRRRRGAAGARTRPRQADRDDPVRYRLSLSVDAVQSRMAGGEGVAGVPLAGAVSERRHSTSRSRSGLVLRVA